MRLRGVEWDGVGGTGLGGFNAEVSQRTGLDGFEQEVWRGWSRGWVN